MRLGVIAHLISHNIFYEGSLNSAKRKTATISFIKEHSACVDSIFLHFIRKKIRFDIFEKKHAKN